MLKVKMRCHNATAFDQGTTTSKTVNLVTNDQLGKLFEEGVQGNLSLTMQGDRLNDLKHGDVVNVTIEVVPAT